MPPDSLLTYLQVASLALLAIYNGIMAYEARPKTGRVILSALTAAFLAGLAWHRVWPIF
jgi:hypothetical protein